ncbi:MAG: BrnT family toxin [Candidatus Omnitrophica bacterium]|nr:BrnT family toxin [Candidatus Omnitrophota bacterium]
MDIQSILLNCTGFQWDKGNSLKSWLKHHVSEGEAEQVFLNEPLLLSIDEKHSQHETRFRVMGYTEADRYLYIAFVVRENLIRVISARDMNKKERVVYEKFKNNT